MKKVLFILVLWAFSLGLKAQTEASFDFNNYLEGADLNGQGGWYVRPHTAANSNPPMYTGYIGNFYKGDPSPTMDETIGVFSTASGTAFGDIATHTLDEYGFDFSSGGVIEVECDMYRGHWGHLFGIGYDANNDGSVIPPFWTAPGHNQYEPLIPNPNSTVPDGGIYMLTTGYKPTDPYFKCGVVLPNNTMACEIQPAAMADCWFRWKICIDLDANNGEGAVTLYRMDNPDSGEWEPVPECQGVNAGLTPGSGDKFDPAMWSSMFMLNNGMGGFDNFNVRHMPGGLTAQFIEFPEIHDQLVDAQPLTLQATASSGLPVTFEIGQGPATIEGNILTLTGEEGLVKVRAIQPGDGTQWQPAPTVTRSFYVVDPANYAPEITIRRPYEGTQVYMPNFEHPVMVVLSAHIDHPEVLKFEEVKCIVDGQELSMKTDYPNDPDNGYWYTTWTPSGPGNYDMTVSITQTGGKVTSASNTFEVTTNYDNLTISALNGEVVVNKEKFIDYGEFPFPTHVNAFNAINLHYLHNCVNGDCQAYDHVSFVRVKNYRGEWVELCRYTTPFGSECEDDLDVTDFTSLLQGLVEFELNCEMYDNGSGYNPTAVFEYTKGMPDYPYVDLQEIWYGTYAFGDYDNLCPVSPYTVVFDPCVEKAKLQLTTTGHNWSDTDHGAYNTGNAAEFYNTTHNIKINGTTAYTQHLWRTCNPNPAGCIQPDYATWYYARSGWCPGSMGLVWDFPLDDYLANGHANLLYEFDPNYVDQCHPNYPDCVSGMNSCPDCQNTSNPILRVSGKIVTYSHNHDLFMDVPVYPDVDKDPFQVTLTPNPVNDRLTITTDYDKGRVGVHIVNSQGAVVRNFNMKGSATIDMNDLPAGIYVVQILGGKMITRKIVKN